MDKNEFLVVEGGRTESENPARIDLNVIEGGFTPEEIEEINQLKQEISDMFDRLVTAATDPDFEFVSDAVIGKMFRGHCRKVAELEKKIGPVRS